MQVSVGPFARRARMGEPGSAGARPAHSSGAGEAANVAVTWASLEAIKLHEPVPEQAPDQPLKTAPLSATAINVTAAPSATTARHCARQPVMPAPLSMPGPLAFSVRVRVVG